ncbi:MAG TPA: formylglycine-generating enzyme family protein, partial [Vicinamibacterales bacterium]|nr:formylglycine-generating enzyme family protein [Vicinamibacterales bacterium]
MARHLAAAVAVTALLDATVAHPAAAPPGAFIEPLTGMVLRALPGGHFMMGSPTDEPGRAADEAPHQVTVSSFYLGCTEVTQAEWTTVMGWNPSHHADCASCPVERVSFFDIQPFLDRLNAAAHGVRYRLPTEAEWEYACRAGTTTPFSTGRTIGS